MQSRVDPAIRTTHKGQSIRRMRPFDRAEDRHSTAALDARLIEETNRLAIVETWLIVPRRRLCRLGLIRTHRRVGRRSPPDILVGDPVAVR